MSLPANHAKVVFPASPVQNTDIQIMENGVPVLPGDPE
jgi:hypothetical protein